MDVPTQQNPKPATTATAATKPGQPSKATAGPRAIKTEQNKVLKKSLSNNDIQIIPNKADAHKPTKTVSTANTRAQIKRHSPSPTQTGKPKSRSPLRPTSSSAKQPMKPVAKMVATKGKTSEPHAKTAPNNVPWADFLYYL